jgi:hypothetical protein
MVGQLATDLTRFSCIAIIAVLFLPEQVHGDREGADGADGGEDVSRRR